MHISDLQITVDVHQDVLRFEVSVSHIVHVKVFQAKKNLASKELSLRLLHHVVVTEMTEEVTSVDERQTQVNVDIVFEDKLQVDKVVVPDSVEHSSLIHCMPDLPIRQRSL